MTYFKTRIKKMIKKSLIVASLLFAGTSAVAQNEYFMGAGISGGSLTPKVVETNSEGAVISTTSESDNGGVFSILGGTIIDDNINYQLAIQHILQMIQMLMWR